MCNMARLIYANVDRRVCFSHKAACNNRNRDHSRQNVVQSLV